MAGLVALGRQAEPLTAATLQAARASLEAVVARDSAEHDLASLAGHTAALIRLTCALDTAAHPRLLDATRAVSKQVTKFVASHAVQSPPEEPEERDRNLAMCQRGLEIGAEALLQALQAAHEAEEAAARAQPQPISRATEASIDSALGMLQVRWAPCAGPLCISDWCVSRSGCAGQAASRSARHRGRA
jgi:hypothetical protein